MTLLATKYRPQTFADLYGQNSARMILQSFVHSGNCPPAFLFTGPSGTGKTSAARILAAALNCLNPINGDCCNECSSCVSIHDGVSSNVHEIDAATSGGIDSIRELKNLAQFGSSGNWRVIILDEAHAMSSQAFNALLKVLEEPPAQTVFVMLTTEPNKIISTVRTRAMPIEFKLLSKASIMSRLKFIQSEEKFMISSQDMEILAEYGDGSLRKSLMLMDQSVRSKIDARQLVGKSNVPLHLLNSVMSQDLEHAHSLLSSYFDNSTDSSDLVAGLIDSLQTKFIEGKVTQNQLIQGMKLLWDARTLNPSARSTRSQLGALVVLLYSLFLNHTPAPQKSILPTVEQSSSPANDSISSMEELISLIEE